MSPANEPWATNKTSKIQQQTHATTTKTGEGMAGVWGPLIDQQIEGLITNDHSTLRDDKS